MDHDLTHHRLFFAERERRGKPPQGYRYFILTGAMWQNWPHHKGMRTGVVCMTLCDYAPCREDVLSTWTHYASTVARAWNHVLLMCSLLDMAPSIHPLILADLAAERGYHAAGQELRSFFWGESTVCRQGCCYRIPFVPWDKLRGTPQEPIPF